MEKLSGEVVDIFEVKVCQNFHSPGPGSYSAGYYLSEHTANKMAKGNGRVVTSKALQVKDGDKYSYFLLESIFVNIDFDEIEIAKSALAKLTNEEKDVLGIVEFEE